MKEKSKKIYINNKPINVTEEIYNTYWEEYEKEKFQNKQYQKYVLSIDVTFGSQEFNPLELELLSGTNPTLDYIHELELYERLVRVLFSLDPIEIDLVLSVYFDNMSQTEYASLIGVTQQSISKKLSKTIRKMKKMLDF